ncbi:MAG: prolipoprotein diacylglyceryl transferase [Caldisericia bacterium]|nr:prolipoprotein diacylglyceryl transferase [Caldisericia bacterium]
MYPIIRIGSFTIRSYGLMMATAVIIGFVSIWNRLKKLGLKEEESMWLLFWLIVGGLIGAKLLFIITNNFGYYLRNLQDLIINLIFGRRGLSFIGAVIGGIISSYLFSKWKKINFFSLLDTLFIGLMLGYAIGRIGCFLNGCCVGLPTNSLIGFRFSPFDYPRYPTQLFTSIGAFIIFFILLRIDSKKKFYGKTFSWALIFYGILTFFIEFLRAVPRFPPLNLSLNQYSTFIVIPFGFFSYIELNRNNHSDNTY